MKRINEVISSEEYETIVPLLNEVIEARVRYDLGQFDNLHFINRLFILCLSCSSLFDKGCISAFVAFTFYQTVLDIYRLIMPEI